MKHISGFLVCTMVALLWTGCGGGSTMAPAATGRLTLTVLWPKRAASSTRLIPVAARSIKAVVTSGSQILGTLVILGDDSAPSNPSTVTFSNLVPGPVTLTATAYPTSQATGVAMATGAQPVTIVSAQTARASVTMASTIDHITITPADPTITVGAFASVTMTAFDASGNIVLTPLTADITSGNTLVAQVAVVGNPSSVNGISPGTTTITARETESGKTASTSITVTQPNQTE